MRRWELFKLTPEETLSLMTQTQNSAADRLISQSVISKKGRGGQRFVAIHEVFAAFRRLRI